MKILGIDTTTKFLSLGLYEDGKICEYNLETGPKLSALLALSIKRVLDARGLGIEEIDYFACGLGPGSFTGMRVGLATLKGIAWALNKRLIGIPTLDILAQAVNASDKPIIPAIDAKRGLIYCAIYKKIKGSLIKKSNYLLLSQEEFYKHLKDEPLIFGDALAVYRQEISSRAKGAILLDKDHWYPKGHDIITLALERIKNKKFSSPLTLKPIYLYPKECQIRK